MKTFPAIFKSVYDEALLDLGFKRAKGRHLYYIRMVGDEIAHIITYTNEQNSRTVWRKSDKAFVVRGGVATVYRKNLTLDRSPSANARWLSTNFHIYFGLHPYEERSAYTESIFEFIYDKDSEDSMYESVRYSLDVTEQIMLPILNKVQTLKDCLDFFAKYGGFLGVHPEEFQGKAGSNSNSEEDFCEGILNLKEYSINEFIHKTHLSHNEEVKYWEYRMRTGKTGMTPDDFEEFMQLLESSSNDHIEDFLSLANDSDKMEKVKAELERRKEQNIEILKKLI